MFNHRRIFGWSLNFMPTTTYIFSDERPMYPCTAINVRTENTEKLDFNSTVDYNTPSIIIPIMSLLFMSNNFSSFIA